MLRQESVSSSCLPVSLVALVSLFVCVVFFFQAEDGIRDLTVTGVQTCALPISVPVYVTVVVILGMYVLLNWMRIGRYFYAIGGNIKASALSGISTRSYLFLAYVLCGFLASLGGVMLTARLETGEANIGAAMPLRSIAACVIGGVSLRGGTGRLGSVVLGAVFIEWFENGMNLVRIQSYLQMVVLGVLLIFAVVMDEVRHRYIAKSRED